MTATPQLLSIRGIATDHALAEAIEGYRPEGLNLMGSSPEGAIFVAGDERHAQYRDIVELRIDGSARVSIERPRFDIAGRLAKAQVTFSSGGGDANSATATAELLAFAVRVAAILDGWAERGELPRLASTEAGS